MITRFFKSATKAPAPTTSNLIVCAPGKQPVHYVLNAETVDVGRSVKSRVRINEEWVSRTHLELRADSEGGYVFHDLKSLNGSRVNGVRANNTKLAHGDFLLIGGRIPAHYMELPLGMDPDPALFKDGRGTHPIPELQGEGEVISMDDNTSFTLVDGADKVPAIFRSVKTAVTSIVVQPIRQIAAML